MRADRGVGGRLHSNTHHAKLFSYPTSQISLSSMGPAVCHGPGVISMKVDWVQAAPFHLHTQTSCAGTELGIIPGGGRTCPLQSSLLVVARCLLSPMLVYGRRFSAMGERVKTYSNLCTKREGGDSLQTNELTCLNLRTSLAKPYPDCSLFFLIHIHCVQFGEFLFNLERIYVL